MPHYMIGFSYTAEHLRALVQKPEDRTPALEALIKNAGGRLISLYYHWGEYDGMVIVDAPDDLTANAIALAGIAAGPVRLSRTVRLFTAKEIVEAFGRVHSMPPPPKAGGSS